MTRFLGAVDGQMPALHLHRAGAVEGGIHVDDALFQRRGQGDGLEGGAGLIGGVHALVAPGGLNSVGLGVCHSGVILLLGGKGHFLALQIRQGLIELFDEFFIGQGAVVIGIIAGEGGHGDNGTGIHIHDDTGGTVFRVELGDHAFHAGFQCRLHIGVQRQHQILAVLCVIILLILVQKFRAAGVSRRDGKAGGSLQCSFILGFQTHATLIFAVDKANDIGRQFRIGVVALGVRLEPHAQNALLLLFGHFIALFIDLAVDESADLVGDILFGLLGQSFIHGIGLFHFRLNDRLVDIQDAGKTPGNISLIPKARRIVGLPLLGGLQCSLLDVLFLLFHVFQDLFGRDVHRFGGGGNGQHMLIPVVNRAAGSRDHGAAGLLIHRFGTKVIVLVDLQIVKLQKQHHKGHNAQKRHHQNGPAADDLVGAAGGIAFSFGTDWHRGTSLGDHEKRPRPFDRKQGARSTRFSLPVGYDQFTIMRALAEIFHQGVHAVGQGCENLSQHIGFFLPVNHGRVSAGEVHIADLAVAGFGHARLLGGSLHRSHVEHPLILRGEGHILGLQLRKLGFQSHRFRGKHRELDIAHQHHHRKAQHKSHGRRSQNRKLLALAHLYMGLGLFGGAAPGLLLGLVLRGLTGSLAGMAQFPLSNFPVKIMGQIAADGIVAAVTKILCCGCHMRFPPFLSVTGLVPDEIKYQRDRTFLRPGVLRFWLWDFRQVQPHRKQWACG